MERCTWVEKAAGKGSIKDETVIWGQGDRTEGDRSGVRLASGKR